MRGALLPRTLLACVWFGACATGGSWRTDLPTALAAARQAGRDVVVFFARTGHEASDRTQAGLGDASVLAALGDGDFVAVVVDAAAQARLCELWLGGRDGFGIAVIDAAGQPYAACPGPQDPDELAAFVRSCAALRPDLAAARAAAAAAGAGPDEQHALGSLYLRLGCRAAAEQHLIPAAMAGVADARHQLARLHAQDGWLAAARNWLAAAPPTPAARATEGYLLCKEKRFREAIPVLEAALQTGRLGEDRQWAMLHLARALHETKDDARAVPLLESLSREGTGSVAEAGARHTLRHIRNADHR